jgi:hypothetical protein
MKRKGSKAWITAVSVLILVVVVIIAAIAGLLSAFTFYQRRND